MEYFKAWAPDEKNGILFVGYQADGTFGRRLQRGLGEASFMDGGRTANVPVRLEIATIEGFSGHSDRVQLMNYVASLDPRPSQIILNHGEESKILDLATACTTVQRREPHRKTSKPSSWWWPGRLRRASVLLDNSACASIGASPPSPGSTGPEEIIAVDNAEPGRVGRLAAVRVRGTPPVRPLPVERAMPAAATWARHLAGVPRLPERDGRARDRLARVGRVDGRAPGGRLRPRHLPCLGPFQVDTLGSLVTASDDPGDQRDLQSRRDRLRLFGPGVVGPRGGVGRPAGHLRIAGGDRRQVLHVLEETTSAGGTAPRTRTSTAAWASVLAPDGLRRLPRQTCPAENHAIQTGVHPRVSTEGSIGEFQRQFREWGISIDWSRGALDLLNPTYYRWTQWIFLELFKAGLAYRREAAVKWCPKDQTVLANEQVDAEGRCERCGALVEVRQLEQWFLRITDYAERLLTDLDTIDWPEHVKTMQRNWIGRSEGARSRSAARSSAVDYPVFTTRPDTLFGATSS